VKCIATKDSVYGQISYEILETFEREKKVQQTYKLISIVDFVSFPLSLSENIKLFYYKLDGKLFFSLLEFDC